MSQLALLGGKKSKSKPFPAWPQFDDTERRGLNDVLESRVWWRTPGTKTLEFEEAFARFHGARHGLAVTNGTAALEVAMAAIGLQPGDEVIVPNFTFVATASAVSVRECASGAGGRSARHLLPRSPTDRGCHHTAHQGDHRGPHGWTSCRSGRVERPC